MEIIVNGETKELNIIDPKTGISWISDLLGNHDAITWIENEEYGEQIATMSQEDFDWWDNLIDEYQEADNRYHDLLTSADNDGYQELQELIANIDGDLEDYPRYLNQICDEFEVSQYMGQVLKADYIQEWFADRSNVNDAVFLIMEQFPTNLTHNQVKEAVLEEVTAFNNLCDEDWQKLPIE